MDKIPRLYKHYYIDKSDERLELFQIIAERYNIKSGLYPGSFVHITPSFVIPEMVYIDMDKRCPKFFQSGETLSFIEKQKKYEEPASVTFFSADFTSTIDEKEESFDLLISLYSGFVSEYCLKYIRNNGIVLANNSHGDAPLAFLNNRLDLVAAAKRRGDHFILSEKEPDSYFHTKSGKKLDKEEIKKTMKGAAYTKTAYAYIFRKQVRHGDV
ncbi:MAG: hypothetical protein JXC36_06410 [Candidatus Atribacteria bacterium]|nr:hypothetical protein [Candidatus Atribacteria bacterium]